jgi:F-type H+-transporting ATPase subunit delta
MADSRVARRYAGALFQAASAADMVRAVESDLAAVADATRNNSEFRHFILTPLVNAEQKISILNKIFGESTTGLTHQVLRLMVERGREAEMEPLYDEYVKLRREQDNIVYGTVTSREPLTPEQKDLLVSKVQNRIGRKLEADFVTDPNLIGGVKVTYNDFVLDGTVRGALAQLREKLRYELLKQS